MSAAIQVSMAGVLAAVCAVVVRKQQPELALLLTICSGVLIFLFCSGAFSSAVGFFRKLTEMSGLDDEIIEPILKVTGIAIVTRLSSEFCKDAKENAIASVVEMAGTLTGVVAVIPLIAAVLQMLSELL